MHHRTTSLAGIVVIATSLALPALARADSTPVGVIPKGPVTFISAPRGGRVAIAVRRPSASSGLVWRIARAIDPATLRQVSEASVGDSVVIVFRAVAPGRVSVVLAATRGDASSKALRSATFEVRVK